eukprot:TRINITY_DN15071_c0_g1_i3.p1 TRINITY_DN15071_c0_g1~~TRINITY_DN15071_c0_g1_i3.p1  ORF type:complete len:639 (+),score=86.16 TRINITY_DN15071_c0_g1_i3:135-2051(+)
MSQLLDGWSVEDVCRRLVGCPWASPYFRHKCRLHRIDGVSLQELTKEDLRDDFRINELGTIKEILRNIKALRAGQVPEVKGGTSTPPVPDDSDDALIVPARASTPQPHVSRSASGTLARKDSAQKDPNRHLPSLDSVYRHRLHTPLSRDTAVCAQSSGPVPSGRRTAPVARRPSLVKEKPLGTTQCWAPPEPTNEVLQQEQVPSQTPPDTPPQPKTSASRIDVRRPSSGSRGRLSVFQPGILELERRFVATRQLFDLWDQSSNISESASGFIEFEELRDVLAPFYGWSPEEKDQRARAIMGALDTSGDQKVDADEFHRFVSRQTHAKKGRDFDSFVAHMRERVSEETRTKEAERRQRSLRSLFRKWDADCSGFVDPVELRSVIMRYNDYSVAQGKHQAQVILTEKDQNRDGRLDQAEFLAVFTALTNRLTPEDFDFLSYRIGRSVEDILQDQRRGLTAEFRPLTVENLEVRYKVSAPQQPLLLFGRGIDPSKQVEQLADAVGARLRPFLVRHVKSEKAALKDMKRWGFGRGHWLYITIDYDVHTAEPFLRQVGVALQQQAVHHLHRKFRLWIMVPTHRYILLPCVLRHISQPVDLEVLRAEREAEHRLLMLSRNAPAAAAAERRETIAVGAVPDGDPG